MFTAEADALDEGDWITTAEVDAALGCAEPETEVSCAETTAA